jgi:hypothetical protein
MFPERIAKGTQLLSCRWLISTGYVGDINQIKPYWSVRDKLCKLDSILLTDVLSPNAHIREIDPIIAC